MSNKSVEKYALISVFDKTNIIDLAKFLTKNNYKIISSGGTADFLKKNKIPVIPVSDITGNPESFDGRIKTISFQVESGILFDRDKKSHILEAKKLNIKPIDIVVCNLYPFEDTISKKSVKLKDAIENIDVGGPTMIRSAAKNFKHVLVLTDPKDYSKIINEFSDLNRNFRQELASKAFYHLSFYDSQIARFFSDTEYPDEITLPGRKKLDLRYGENPHQSASVYLQPNSISLFNSLTKKWGRDLSLTNLTDINAGFELAREFSKPTSVIIKHNNPCGVAIGDSLHQAIDRSIESDPESAFGGVIVVNKPIDLKSAEKIVDFKKSRKSNIDIVVTPSIDKKAFELLTKLRKSMGIYVFDFPKEQVNRQDLKWIDGGFVVQSRDEINDINYKDWKIVTKIKPSKIQFEQMKLAWKFITRIKSNSVIVVDKSIPMTRGIGTGQTSRVRSTKIALDQAGNFTDSAIMASDSFFPFDDSVVLASKYKIGAIIQQGGSISDESVINTANKLKIPMVFTYRRAFWH